MAKNNPKKGSTRNTRKPRITKTSGSKLGSTLFSVQVISVLGVLIVLSILFFYWLQRTNDLQDTIANEQPLVEPQDPSIGTGLDSFKLEDQSNPLNRPENTSQPDDQGLSDQSIEQQEPFNIPSPQDTLRPIPQGPEVPDRLAIPFAGHGKRIPIVIVIDDVGYDLKLLESFLPIPVPITFAILPGVPHTTEAALLLSLYEQEILLHQPMENVLGLDPGPGTLESSMSDDELRDHLLANIQQIPGIVGMNNHMGSKGTQDRRIMNIVLEVAQELNLFFLDSRTTAQSVAKELSSSKQLPFMERHVFLDNETTREAILDALLTGLEQASTRGYAVMIGHVWTQELADILLELYPDILDQGYDFVSLMDLLQLRPRD